MSPREVDRSLEILRKSGLIETQLWHYHDKKTTHIRIEPAGFMDAVHAASKGDKCRDKRKFTRPQKLAPTLKSLNREILPCNEIGTDISLNSDLHITKQENANDEIGICYISENTPKITLKEHTQRISPLPPAGGTPPAAAGCVSDKSFSSSTQEQKEPDPDQVDPEEYHKARRDMTQAYISGKSKVKSSKADWEALARERMAAAAEKGEGE